MAKTYQVLKDHRDDGTRWSKKDFTDRNINRNLRNLDRVEIEEFTNKTVLTMFYKKGIKGGDGKIALYKEEKAIYTKDNTSACYFLTVDNTTK